MSATIEDRLVRSMEQLVHQFIPKQCMRHQDPSQWKNGFVPYRVRIQELFKKWPGACKKARYAVQVEKPYRVNFEPPGTVGSRDIP